MNLEPSPAVVDRLIRIDEVANRVGISVRQAWRHDRAGKLPAPVRLGRSVRWRNSEINAWIAAGCPPRDEWAVRWQALQSANAMGRLLTSRPLAS
jgi:excisionase family DNA binding protein